jgi:transposase
MKLFELLPIIQDEKKSEDYLRSVGILKTFSNCPRCSGTSLGMIRGDRWKCYKCKTEWTRRKDSILSLVRIKYSEFLFCLKCFELELTAEETAGQLEINYRSIRTLFLEIRKSLVNIPIKQNLYKEIRFQIRFDDKKVFIDLVNDQEVGSGANVIVTKKRIQDSASIYQFSLKQLKKYFKYFNVDEQPKDLSIFWRFAKERLLKYRGTDNLYLILFLKEIEFRFNTKSEDLYAHLIEKIAQNQRVVK